MSKVYVKVCMHIYTMCESCNLDFLSSCVVWMAGIVFVMFGGMFALTGRVCVFSGSRARVT